MSVTGHTRMLHPFCKTCGWRKGGLDSWDGRSCKCGHYEPALPEKPATVTTIKPQGFTYEQAGQFYTELQRNYDSRAFSSDDEVTQK